MNLKERIRTALKEDAEARKYVKWNVDDQPNLYQLDVFLRKSGYRLANAIRQGSGVELMIEPVKADPLHPQIHHDVATKDFLITVDKRGQFNSAEMREMVEGYTTALGVVDRINNLDLSKLEVRKG